MWVWTSGVTSDLGWLLVLAVLLRGRDLLVGVPVNASLSRLLLMLVAVSRIVELIDDILLASTFSRASVHELLMLSVGPSRVV